MQQISFKDLSAAGDALVYADWLDGQGLHHRAYLIRKRRLVTFRLRSSSQSSVCGKWHSNGGKYRQDIDGFAGTRFRSRSRSRNRIATRSRSLSRNFHVYSQASRARRHRRSWSISRARIKVAT